MVGFVELDWMETFLAVADTRGFTAAGEVVHRSQSRVSAHIAALERDIGVRLIDRTRRPATLTAAGEVFVRHARDIVAGVSAARSAVGAFRSLDEGSIALLTTPCLGASLFPRVLADLAAEHPGLRAELVERTDQDLERWFLAEGIAMAVLPALRGPSATDLRKQVLWRQRFVAVVPVDHELAGGCGPVGLTELVRHALVLCGASAGASRRCSACSPNGGAPWRRGRRPTARRRSWRSSGQGSAWASSAPSRSPTWTSRGSRCSTSTNPRSRTT